MDYFRECWSRYDPEGKYTIRIEHFSKFMSDLGAPLGFNDAEKLDQKKQRDFMKHIELPTYDNCTYYYYYDILQALSRNAYMKIETERKLKSHLYD